MPHPPPLWNSPSAAHACVDLARLCGPVLGWSAATIGCYLAASALYRRWPRWWLTPLAVAPTLLLLAATSLHVSYGQYLHGAGWLERLLAPATVAFAVPIYEQRRLIQRHWLALGAAVLAGSAAAMLTSWLLASLLGLTGTLRLSLLPRSMSTPFAMAVSGELGGTPALTAVFVVLTGVLGACLGEVMLARLPLHGALARGAMLGMGAHGVGTARAHRYGREEGAVAGVVLVLVGLANVLAAPLIAEVLR
ncbi:MAG TPA: LrgB family protein [Steroidobacteraceae bacterium]|nr:LrgB family protein [Steroidobacteraceae bacterium]